MRTHLQPATVVRVNIDDENTGAEVIVPDDQLSLAIGRRGQNARLAAKLTGWKIDIKSESEADVQFKEEIAGELFKPVETDSASPAGLDLIELDGVGTKTAELLRDSGFSTVESIAQATLEELSSLPGIGAKTAEKIHHAASEILLG